VAAGPSETFNTGSHLDSVSPPPPNPQTVLGRPMLRITTPGFHSLFFNIFFHSLEL
ncbi:hypothetical protein HispidOSU_029342, partial [Sigmodon hispidus]